MNKTLLVVDDDCAALAEQLPGVISFDAYLRDYPKLNEPKTQVINLCDTERYLSKGYYCSLLAEARQHIALPSVKTINALRDGVLALQQAWLSEQELQDLQSVKHQDGACLIYLGQAEQPHLQKLASKLFRRYPAPILLLRFCAEQGQFLLQRLAFYRLSAEQQAAFMAAFDTAPFKRKRTVQSKRYRWDMAILVNPQEKVPPSNKGAIARFLKAAAKLGIRARTVQSDELLDVNHFDALFIRETTAIDHATYRLACQAEAQGLVVLDDPSSILRCCNKVFLHDAFQYQGVPSPETAVVAQCDEATIQQLEQRFEYPMVLKMPEGSFSKGVFKVADRAELQQKLQQLFEQSALALVQAYLYTEYDWRIGVLNGRPIYACRYYMARNHWQIYNHGSKRFFSGGFECLATFEVPKPVLDAAVLAAKVVGNGLYGVDIKLRDNKAYVIEVNDNPNIDHGVEDQYLGEELYMQIMSDFLRRLEARGR